MPSSQGINWPADAPDLADGEQAIVAINPDRSLRVSLATGSTVSLGPSAGGPDEGPQWVRLSDGGNAIGSSNPLPTSDQPFQGARLVVLSSDTTFTDPPRSVYIGTAGNLKVDMLDIDGITSLTAQVIKVTDFQVLPFANITKIYSTANGTTASNIIVGV